MATSSGSGAASPSVDRGPVSVIPPKDPGPPDPAVTNPAATNPAATNPAAAFPGMAGPGEPTPGPATLPPSLPRPSLAPATLGNPALPPTPAANPAAAGATTPLAHVVEHFANGHPRAPESTPTRHWVPEAPVALEYNGIAYAVMMATPADLADFATGFAITEGLSPSPPTDIAIAEVEAGWIVRATLPPHTGLGDAPSLPDRVRTRLAESSCGLCGIESLEAVARPLPPVPAHSPINPAAIFAALAALRPLQTLGAATHAAHAAAHADATGTITLIREDVGRHNALDKLIGGMARKGARAHQPLAPNPLSEGFILSTARCSYEIVEKAVRAGATTLVTISLPTSLAVTRARGAGLSLWVLARPDSVLCLAP